jgi:cation transport regulator ChaB
MAFETVSDLTGSVQAALVSAAYIIFGKNFQTKTNRFKKNYQFYF